MATIKKYRLETTIALIITLLHLPVVFSHQNYLLTWFNTDDAFYYFKTAQNIAAGKGITFDGIAPTNGFHPLWMLVITPIFRIPGMFLPLRILTVVLILLNLASALILFRLTSQHLSPGVAFLVALAWSLLPSIHGFTTRGGMESGISAFFMILFLFQLSRTDGKNPRKVLVLSGIAALTFLARLDNVFLVYLGGGWLVLRIWVSRKQRGGWDLKPAITYFAPLSLVVVVYMLWNLIGFGTLTPVSGQVKQWWGTLPNSVYGFPPKRLINYIGQFFTAEDGIGPWSFITRPYYSSAEVLLALFGLDVTTGARRLSLAGLGLVSAGVAGFLVLRNRRFFGQAIKELALIPLFLGCLVQIAYYKTSGSVAERGWYWIGEMLFVVITGGVFLESFHRIFSDILGKWWSLIPLQYAGTVLLSLVLIGPHLPRVGRILSPEIENQTSFYLKRAGWLETNTEPGSTITMTGTGSSAYFTQGRTFVNLDGLINSTEYFHHLQDGTAHQYLASIGVDYVFGNQYIIQESDPYQDIFEDRLELQAFFIDGDKELVLWRFTP